MDQKLYFQMEQDFNSMDLWEFLGGALKQQQDYFSSTCSSNPCKGCWNLPTSGGQDQKLGGTEPYFKEKPLF